MTQTPRLLSWSPTSVIIYGFWFVYCVMVIGFPCMSVPLCISVGFPSAFSFHLLVDSLRLLLISCLLCQYSSSSVYFCFLPVCLSSTSRYFSERLAACQVFSCPVRMIKEREREKENLVCLCVVVFVLCVAGVLGYKKTSCGERCKRDWELMGCCVCWTTGKALCPVWVCYVLLEKWWKEGF